MDRWTGGSNEMDMVQWDEQVAGSKEHWLIGGMSSNTAHRCGNFGGWRLDLNWILVRLCSAQSFVILGRGRVIWEGLKSDHKGGTKEWMTRWKCRCRGRQLTLETWDWCAVPSLDRCLVMALYSLPCPISCTLCTKSHYSMVKDISTVSAPEWQRFMDVTYDMIWYDMMQYVYYHIITKSNRTELTSPFPFLFPFTPLLPNMKWTVITTTTHTPKQYITGNHTWRKAQTPRNRWSPFKIPQEA